MEFCTINIIYVYNIIETVRWNTKVTDSFTKKLNQNIVILTLDSFHAMKKLRVGLDSSTDKLR